MFKIKGAAGREKRIFPLDRKEAEEMSYQKSEEQEIPKLIYYLGGHESKVVIVWAQSLKYVGGRGSLLFL